VTSVDQKGRKAFIKTAVPFSSLNHPEQKVQFNVKEYVCNRLFPLKLAESNTPRGFDALALKQGPALEV